MHTKQWSVALLSGCLWCVSCAHSTTPMTVEQQIAAYGAEVRTAIIEEKNTPILLGAHAATQVPSLFPNLAPGIEAGWAYWEWIEISGEGTRKLVKTGYGRLSAEGVEFPFAGELDFSKIYLGINTHLTFVYKNPAGEFIQRLVLPGILSRHAKEKRNLSEMQALNALHYADENTLLVELELIPVQQRASLIANLFEMIFLP